STAAAMAPWATTTPLRTCSPPATCPPPPPSTAPWAACTNSPATPRACRLRTRTMTAPKTCRGRRPWAIAETDHTRGKHGQAADRRRRARVVHRRHPRWRLDHPPVPRLLRLARLDEGPSAQGHLPGRGDLRPRHFRPRGDRPDHGQVPRPG